MRFFDDVMISVFCIVLGFFVLRIFFVIFDILHIIKTENVALVSFKKTKFHACAEICLTSSYLLRS